MWEIIILRPPIPISFHTSPQNVRSILPLFFQPDCSCGRPHTCRSAGGVNASSPITMMSFTNDSPLAARTRLATFSRLTDKWHGWKGPPQTTNRCGGHNDAKPIPLPGVQLRGKNTGFAENLATPSPAATDFQFLSADFQSLAFLEIASVWPPKGPLDGTGYSPGSVLAREFPQNMIGGFPPSRTSSLSIVHTFGINSPILFNAPPHACTPTITDNSECSMMYRTASSPNVS